MQTVLEFPPSVPTFKKSAIEELGLSRNIEFLTIPLKKYKNKPLALLARLMFTDYNYLRWVYDEWFPANRKWAYDRFSDLFSLLEYLMQRGENRPVVVRCFECQRTVEFISVAYSIETDERGEPQYSMSSGYTYCSNCIDYVIPRRIMKLRPRFSEILNFRYKVDQKTFIGILKDVLGFNGNVTAQKALAFFATPSTTHDYENVFDYNAVPV